MNSRKFLVATLLLTALPLAACSDASDNATDAAAGQLPLEITNARLVLPPVSGNPAAVYFDVKNNGTKNYAIRAATVAGAQNAELHGSMEMDGKMTMDSLGQVLVNAGETETFAPGGYHVMAFDPDPALEAGGTTEMTLTVVGGKTLTVPVEVRAAGEDR